MRNCNRAIVVFVFVIGVSVLSGQEILEVIVAIVNDDVITLSDYKREYDNLYRMLRTRYQGEQFDQQWDMAKANLLDTMITDLLLLQEANKMGLNVSEQVKMTIENIKSENNLATDASWSGVIPRSKSQATR